MHRRGVASSVVVPDGSPVIPPTRRKRFRVLDVVSYDQGHMRLRTLLVLAFGLCFLTAQWFLVSLLGVAVEDADPMDIATDTMWTLVGRTLIHSSFGGFSPTVSILSTSGTTIVSTSPVTLQGSLPDPRVLLPGLSQSLGPSYSLTYLSGTASVPIVTSDKRVTLSLSFTLPGNARTLAALQTWHRDCRPQVATLQTTSSNSTYLQLAFQISVPGLHIVTNYDTNATTVQVLQSVSMYFYPKNIEVAASGNLPAQTVSSFAFQNVSFAMATTASAGPGIPQHVTVQIHDVNEPVVTISAFQSWTFAYAGLLLTPIILGLILAYCYLRVWVLMRNVRENNGLPPLFYEGMLEYRGW